MFKDWSSSDWITLIGIIAPLIVAMIVVLARFSKRIGVYEAEHGGMKTAIQGLEAKAVEHGGMKAAIQGLEAKAVKHEALDTAVALLTQGMAAVQTAFVNLRDEIREDRTEVRDGMKEIRHDVKNLMTGRVGRSRSDS